MSTRCFALAIRARCWRSAASLGAEVTRVDIQRREDVLGGKSFGSAGPYEKLIGRVHFAVDPDNPRNKIIVDLDKAPKNAAGQGRVLVGPLHHQAERPGARQRRRLLRHRQSREQAAAPCVQPRRRIGRSHHRSRFRRCLPAASRATRSWPSAGSSTCAKGKGLVGFERRSRPTTAQPITGWVKMWFISEQAGAVVRVRGERLQHLRVSAARSRQPEIPAHRARGHLAPVAADPARRVAVRAGSRTASRFPTRSGSR